MYKTGLISKEIYYYWLMNLLQAFFDFLSIECLCKLLL